MIQREITIKITENKTTLNSSIILYRGDGNILFKFNIKDGRYRYYNSSNVLKGINNAKADATIKSSDGEQIFYTQKTPCVDNIVQVIITKDMIDEVTEVGVFYMQIHIYDDDDNRVTLPEFSILVKECIAPIPMPDIITSSSAIGIARCNRAMIGSKGRATRVRA